MLGPCFWWRAQLYRHSGTVNKITDVHFITRCFACSNSRFGNRIPSEKGIPENVRLLMRRVTQPGILAQ